MQLGFKQYTSLVLRNLSVFDDYNSLLTTISYYCERLLIYYTANFYLIHLKFRELLQIEIYL